LLGALSYSIFSPGEPVFGEGGGIEEVYEVIGGDADIEVGVVVGVRRLGQPGGGEEGVVIEIDEAVGVEVSQIVEFVCTHIDREDLVAVGVDEA